ncbi:MAG: hypothetical protein ACRCZI_13130 [Cetobacterium sp.]
MNLEKQIYNDVDKDPNEVCDKCRLFLFDDVMDEEHMNPLVLDHYEISHAYSNSYWRDSCSIKNFLPSISEISPYHLHDNYAGVVRKISGDRDQIIDIMDSLDINDDREYETYQFMEFFKKNLNNKIFVFEC